jgi:signal transduction histidine kinase
MARLNLDLIRLNEQHLFDLPDFLRASWPLLTQAGLVGMRWQLTWFGTPLAGEYGAQGATMLERRLAVGDNILELRLYHSRLRGEQRYLFEFLAENYLLLLHMDLWIKAGSVQGAFAQAARLGLFVQHDMKNIAQFIELAADQIENSQPGHEGKLLDSLRTVFPALRVRASRILGTLTGQNQGTHQRRYALAESWQQAAAIHDLNLVIAGTAEVTLPEGLLESILDNLLGNYANQRHDNCRQPTLSLTLASRPNRIVASLTDTSAPPLSLPAERLFEPFWTNRPGGLGIGLYQARNLAISIGGSLEALTPAKEPLTFVLNLPESKV